MKKRRRQNQPSDMKQHRRSRLSSKLSSIKRRRTSDVEQTPGFLYWSMLPDDLKVEILCRLECKHLIRLKCVSKSWHLLISSRCSPIISSSRFCGLIMTNMSDRHGAQFDRCTSFAFTFCCRGHHDVMQSVNFALKKIVGFLPQPEELQDCCNGVLLIAHFAKCPRQYYVCNPTTRQCIKVPVNKEHYGHTYKASMIFDPMDVNSPNSFMIIVPREYSKHFLKLDVFSSGLGNWSSCIVALDSFVDGSKLTEHCVYLKGRLYMLSADKYLVSISFKGKSSDSLLAAASRAIELPGKKELDSCGSLGVAKRDLLYSTCDPLNIMIWVLENGGGCWVLQHIINFGELQEQAPVLLRMSWESSGGMLKLCAYHPYSDEIFVAGRNSRILKYNPRTKDLKVHHIFGSSWRLDNVFPVSLCAVILDNVRH